MFYVPEDEQIESTVGLIIGHHYASGTDPVIMTMDKTGCCGLTTSDYGKYIGKDLLNHGLPVGVTVSGYGRGLRTAGVAAHVITGMFYALV